MCLSLTVVCLTAFPQFMGVPVQNPGSDAKKGNINFPSFVGESCAAEGTLNDSHIVGGHSKHLCKKMHLLMDKI